MTIDVADFVTVGAHSYGNPQIKIYESGNSHCTVGRYCSVGDHVCIYVGGDHPTNYVSTYPLRVALGLPGAHEDGIPTTKGDVVIGSDVWIGDGVTIMSGVTIGDGAVIGAHAVVASDVPPYAVAVGNPARVVKYRFTPGVIRRLSAVRWWDWLDTDVIDAVGLLSSPDIEGFLQYAEGRGS